jgi:hypothetical protein
MREEKEGLERGPEPTHDPNSSVFKPGTALVSYQKLRWTLSNGESVSVGRQSSCEIRVGSPELGPEDLGVSRRAATLSHAQGRMWIRNDSTTQPVFVRPVIGQGYVLERRGDTVSLAESMIEIVLEGRVMTYRLTVDLPEGATPGGGDEPVTMAPMTQAALSLKPRERRMLAALCEPMLTASGQKAVRSATYREMAARLGLSDHTVRNQLDALREQLLQIGIPGMIGSEAKDNLARYAVRSGSITQADIMNLGDRRATGGSP